MLEWYIAVEFSVICGAVVKLVVAQTAEARPAPARPNLSAKTGINLW